MRQSAYLIVLASWRTQSQCSSSSRERATNHIVTRPNISSSVHFTSQIAKLSFYCLKVKDQNCCPQSRFTSSGRRPTKIRLWPGICPGPRWLSLQRSPDPLAGLGEGEAGKGRRLEKTRAEVVEDRGKKGWEKGGEMRTGEGKGRQGKERGMGKRGKGEGGEGRSPSS